MTERPRSWPKLPGPVVKSAGRALQILEFFDDVQRDANVVEVARALSYPQSSASTLLRSLVAMGYLSYDRGQRTYRPTTRVRLLGSWIDPPLFSEGKLPRLLQQLNAATEDTVIIAARNGLFAQYIHVVQATTSLRLHLTPGTLRPLAASGAGWALLSTLPDDEIRKLVRRINAEAPPGQALVDIARLLDRMAEIRERGYALSVGQVTQGGAILAAMLPAALSETPLVIGIGGASERIASREVELAGLLKEMVDLYLHAPG